MTVGRVLAWRLRQELEEENHSVHRVWCEVYVAVSGTERNTNESIIQLSRTEKLHDLLRPSRVSTKDQALCLQRDSRDLVVLRRQPFPTEE